MAAPSAEHVTSVLIVGGGPSGLAAAITLARAGIGVTVADAKSAPHPRVATGALTPRTMTELASMIDVDSIDGHAISGVRVLVHGRVIELPWPEHPDHIHGARIVARRDLDGVLMETALAAGALVWSGTTATTPLIDDGIVAGAVLEQLHPNGETTSIDARASYVLIADGALSHFGRALGTARNRSDPMGVVARARFPSPDAGDQWIETAIDLRDQIGDPIPGFGWVFPGGDDHITVGVGVLTAFRESEGPPINDLLTSWLRRLPGHWGIDPDSVDPDQIEFDTGRLPMGGSVNPKSGPNWLVAGDAAGMTNPINGAGIESALETGRIAAAVLREAIETDNGLVLRWFERYLSAERGRQLKVARLAARAVTRPRVSLPLTNWASRSPELLGGCLRIVTGLQRADSPGRAERNFERAARIASFVPEPSS